MTPSAPDPSDIPPAPDVRSGHSDAPAPQPVEFAAGWEQFEPLYDEHHLRLYRFAMLLCNGRPAVAEDAVAETFVHVFQAWRSGRVQNFLAYARQTLINIVLGQHRRETVARRYLSAQRGDERGVGEAAEQTVERSSMFAYLEQLSNRQRAAVVLRFYEDMSYEQIAIALDVAIGTAKSHVALGVQRLREMMER
jgi:RNA polymerase sigma factor (sigma-70 family)